MKTESAPTLTITEFQLDPVTYNTTRWKDFVQSVLVSAEMNPHSDLSEDWRLGLGEFRAWAEISRQRRAEKQAQADTNLNAAPEQEGRECQQ